MRRTNIKNSICFLFDSRKVLEAVSEFCKLNRECYSDIITKKYDDALIDHKIIISKWWDKNVKTSERMSYTGNNIIIKKSEYEALRKLSDKQPHTGHYTGKVSNIFSHIKKIVPEMVFETEIGDVLIYGGSFHTQDRFEQMEYKIIPNELKKDEVQYTHIIDIRL
jgi:hypothetical protein